LVFVPGDGFIFIWIYFWAVQVRFIARFSADADPFQLFFAQSLFTRLMSFGAGLFLGGVVFDQVPSADLPILLEGVIPIGIANTLQVKAQ